MLWAVGIVAVVALLLGAHSITGDDVALFCVVVASIILHEISHGWVANLCGDDTAKRAGRLSLNPLRHIDPVGTLILPALMVLSTGFLFGWAKPVPVDTRRLRSPRNQAVLVGLAGPATNLLLVAAAAIAFRYGLAHQLALFRLGFSADVPFGWRLVYDAGYVNLVLGLYNLLPIPPLDGSALVERLVPASAWPGYLRVRRYLLPVTIGVMLLSLYIHVGGTTLLGRLSADVESLWDRICGLG
ncbi:MAG TPA: site-2 protease family protein [Acidimicrobiales bacterium]